MPPPTHLIKFLTLGHAYKPILLKSFWVQKMDKKIIRDHLVVDITNIFF